MRRVIIDVLAIALLFAFLFIGLACHLNENILAAITTIYVCLFVFFRKRLYGRKQA